MRNSGLNFSFALAKGRGRYLCLSKLDILLQEGHAQSATAQLFEEEGFHIEVDERSQKLFNSMIEKLAGNRWDGDRDSWSEAIEDQDWARLTTDHSQCTGRHCPNFQQCVFYKAREGMGKVDVIVTNHDMVLADLALGGGAVLPDPRDTVYVFDEGHHLPDKAIGHFAHYSRLRSTADWLEQTAKNLTSCWPSTPCRATWASTSNRCRSLRGSAHPTAVHVHPVRAGRRFPPERGYRRPRAPALSLRGRRGAGTDPRSRYRAEKGFARLNDLFTRLADLLKEGMDGEVNIGIASHQAEEWYPLFGSLVTRAQGNWELWTAFTAEDPEDSPPMARWLTLAESGALFDIEVNASPILAAEMLRRSLWSVAHGALVTSATLTALGKFDRFRMRSGLPRDAVTCVVPSPFVHGDAGLLRVPDLKADPRDAAAHTAAIIRELPGIVEDARVRWCCSLRANRCRKCSMAWTATGASWC